MKAAEAATLEGCLSLHKEALSRVLPVGLVYGNASPDDARVIWKKVRAEGSCFYGVMWDGMEWSGMVWCGMMWWGVVLDGMVWYVWYGML